MTKTSSKKPRATKSTHIDVTKVPSDELGKLIASVQLYDVSLFDLKAEYHPANFENGKGATDLIARPAATRAERVADDTLYCGVRLEVLIGAEDKSTAVVYAFAEYGLLYRIPAELEFSPETAEVFACRNAVFNSWPFFRELVHSVVGRMNLPSTIIPSFRLPLSPG